MDKDDVIDWEEVGTNFWTARFSGFSLCVIKNPITNTHTFTATDGFVTIRNEQPVGLSEAKSDAVRSVMTWRRGTRLHHGESV